MCEDMGTKCRKKEREEAGETGNERTEVQANNKRRTGMR